LVEDIELDGVVGNVESDGVVDDSESDGMVQTERYACHCFVLAEGRSCGELSRENMCGYI